ncbi:class I SAM-dependent methyltransferase [Parasedimentitalea maritima]|uniref:Methyltransferase domain-containing protein n=1 Tax=Parasedimentitalea maritima TaxID=2578117 RepID=A0A6A4RGX4_9RHOB|nr:class I SAM-dependent methyltransferase [Zongyanglinia marina]KAE9628474.1 methyltransferase domain-containing protein [Zongyanglinia marina]
MNFDRPAIDLLSSLEELATLSLNYSSITDEECMLLGYQRTKQISRKSRLQWEQGNQAVLSDEVKSRKQSIIEGAFLEIYQEYIPLKHALGDKKIEHTCDIGCGQGINDVFLFRDFKSKFTLVDIEESPEMYHNWAESGSGYASLKAASNLLIANGVDANDVTAINPTKANISVPKNGFDLVTSFYSCGFHYPIDDYLDLMAETINKGGYVCLDLRKQYLRSNTAAVSNLFEMSKTTEVYNDNKSTRMLFEKK